MLSSAGFVLAMNNYGPIADNAGGIAEMSQQPEHVRNTTDRLDAAGNVTKAISKGYSIGSAALACFLLFGAFLDEFAEYSGVPFESVNIAVPEVLVSGILGMNMVFLITGLAVASVGRAAGKVVEEVRRQFKENPDILTFKAKPDYRVCVEIVTATALREMRLPGILAVAIPCTVGIVFRFVGESTGRPLLGAECLGSFMMFCTVGGIMMALFLDTAGGKVFWGFPMCFEWCPRCFVGAPVGFFFILFFSAYTSTYLPHIGAWDNAKKFVELGNFGGKGSDAHKASITGDTVGDPFKDTAGPALHVVIKLLSTSILVLAPLFIRAPSAA